MRDWIDTKFPVAEGQSQEGIALNEKTGEIYGVPAVPGDNAAAAYTFTAEASYFVEGQDGYFNSSYAEYSLVIELNTDGNVYAASGCGEGHKIKQYIGTHAGRTHSSSAKSPMKFSPPPSNTASSQRFA